MATYNIFFIKGFGSIFLENRKLQLNIRVQDKVPVKVIIVKENLIFIQIKRKTIK